MSHITEMKTNIAFKAQGILAEALDACAAMRTGCTIRYDEKDRRYTVQWGELQAYRANALTFVWREEDGAYVTEGDTFLVRDEIRGFLDDLQVAYQQTAVSKWMRTNRFAAPAVERRGQEVVMTARRW